ncbi:MAG: PDZ domain-containing protein [Woeseiaceae bacterium]|nr:PDZ domain-containing protein [Woeseiaceae bacterium]
MAHRYSIIPSDPAAHLYEVRVTVEKPDPEGQRFRMPAWIPGSYMIRDYARNVVAIRAESDGVDVPLTKVDKSTWAAANSDRELTLVLEVFAHDESVRGAHLDTTHAYFNGPCVFPAVVGQESETCELEILQPHDSVGDDWRVATSMNRAGAPQYGFGTYTAEDYDELIDHPVEIGHLSIGEFEAAGIPHAIAIRGRAPCDMSRLCHDLKTVCEQHLSFLGPPENLDRYLFLLHATGSGYGGLEHRWSSSLVSLRDCLPWKGQEEVDEGYRTFLGLVSHEYFHLWNVKRIRPSAVADSDLMSEAYTELLWVFEGITSYYDDLMLLRSGLIGEQSYLELLGRTITRMMRGAGRTRQSVAESSFDAWIKLYKADANASNAIMSYYVKGALIALCLDLKIRQETDGKQSLDDVMHAVWERHGNIGESMPEGGFESLCVEVTGLDLGDFFDAAVRGTGELPLKALLHSHGVDLHMRATIDRRDKGGKKREKATKPSVTLGATLSEKDGKLVFAAVANGGPAEEAGVSPGDVAVALDGLSLTNANVAQRLKRCRPNDKMPLVVFRGDELLELKIRFEAPPEDTAYLELDEDVDVHVEARRAAWLAG